jgi:hypothetical protein
LHQSTEEEDDTIAILERHFPLDFRYKYARKRLMACRLEERMIDNIRRFAELLLLGCLHIVRLDLGGNHTFESSYNTHALILCSYLGYRIGAEAIKYIAKSLRFNTILSKLDLLCNQKSRGKQSQIGKFNFFLKLILPTIFGIEGANYIAKSLRFNTSISKLNFRDDRKIIAEFTSFGFFNFM